MSLWPYTVELDGAVIPLTDVEADVVIHHGRSAIEDEPTASTAQLVFHSVDNAFVTAFEVGQSLKVTVRDGAAAPVPRFTGRITDARLDVDRLTVIAVGRWAQVRAYVVGDVDWPAESWSARVTRLFTEAGQSALLVLEPDAGFNPQIAARTTATAGPTTLGDYLTFLAAMVGALVADLPDGKILVQAIGARSLAAAVELDPADVAYAPAWLEQLPGGNIVKVRYQADQGQSVTVTDSGSVSQYGERPETIDTAFVNSADATTRANTRLGRAAYSHWEIPEAPLLRGLELRVGHPVILAGLPPAAPFEPWSPVVEGWTDTITGDDWAMALALSDPLISGLALPWNVVPPEPDYRWNTVDTATDWTEALTLEALNAG